jgi:hypothetical protein
MTYRYRGSSVGLDRSGRSGGRSEPTSLSLEERVALERAPKRSNAASGGSRGRVDLPDLAGKAWNLPNTTLGLGYGLAGHVAGELNRLRPGDQPDPRIQAVHNAVEFINNPQGA